MELESKEVCFRLISYIRFVLFSGKSNLVSISKNRSENRGITQIKPSHPLLYTVTAEGISKKPIMYITMQLLASQYS